MGRTPGVIEKCQSPSTYKRSTLAVGLGAARGPAGRGKRGVGTRARQGLALHSQPARPVDQRPQHFCLPPSGRARRYCATWVSRSRAHLKLPVRCARPKPRRASREPPARTDLQVCDSLSPSNPTTCRGSSVRDQIGLHWNHSDYANVASPGGPRCAISAIRTAPIG